MKDGFKNSVLTPRAAAISDGAISAVSVSVQGTDGKRYYALLNAPEFVLQHVTEDESLVATLIEKHGFVPVPARAPVLKRETLYEDLAALRASFS